MCMAAPLPRPPSDKKFLSHYTGSHQGRCGLILNWQTWPQRLEMNRGIIFWLILLSWGIQHFKGPSNQLWNLLELLLPSCKHYNLWTCLSKVVDTWNSNGRQTLQSFQRTNSSIIRCAQSTSELKLCWWGGQRSGLSPRKWVSEGGQGWAVIVTCLDILHTHAVTEVRL